MGCAPGGEGTTGLSTVLVRLCLARFAEGVQEESVGGSELGASESSPGAWREVSGGLLRAEGEVESSHSEVCLPPCPPPGTQEEGNVVCACLWGEGVDGGGGAQRVLTEPRGLALSLVCTANHLLPFFLKNNFIRMCFNE